MCVTWPHVCFTIHLIWYIVYTIIGTIQIICGVFFFISLPVLKLGSNIWIGAWNVTFGIGGAVTALIGKWTISKQRAFLYLAVSVLIANVINLVLLEVGEWHMLLSESAKKLIEQGKWKTLVLYARTITSVSTIVAAVVAFVDSQLTFCSMQYHEKYHNAKKAQKQDVLSDTEYILPRVKSDSDENDNAGYFDKQYPQSWVYETQTAETSTINSGAPNRYSGASSSGENLVSDSKHASSGTEFKDISTQNLTMEQPIVVVEKTADYTDRQLHYMASFSRTPSPVPGSDTSSEDSRTNTGLVLEQSVEKLAASYRSRVSSTLSASEVRLQEARVSPRPPSISGMDQLQQELLKANLHESLSQKSFKISADQIFIPLKDETVIRVKDEVFIIPSPKAPTKIEETPVQRAPKTPSSPLTSFKKADFFASVAPSAAAPSAASPPAEFNLNTRTPFEPAEEPPPVRRVEPPATRPTLPEIVDALRKESFHATSSLRTPTPEKTVEETELLCRTAQVTSPQPQRTASPPPPKELPLTAETQFQTMTSSPAGTYTLPSPVLERQSKFDRQDTVIERAHEQESPMSDQHSSFERQDTVVERLPPPLTPSPLSERQSQIERQDAVFSPREDQCFIPPPLEADDPLMDDGLRGDDVESIYSKSVSTDRESVLEFRASDENLAAADNKISPLLGNCDRLDLLDGIERPPSTTATTTTNFMTNGASAGYSSEIDNIFKIAEDSRMEGDDRKDDELFDMERASLDLPPPNLDTIMFANIPPPPPQQADDEGTNSADPDEWEESEEDSIDSSCAQRVPPHSTPSND